MSLDLTVTPGFGHIEPALKDLLSKTPTACFVQLCSFRGQMLAFAGMSANEAPRAIAIATSLRSDAQAQVRYVTMAEPELNFVFADDVMMASAFFRGDGNQLFTLCIGAQGSAAGPLLLNVRGAARSLAAALNPLGDSA